MTAAILWVLLFMPFIAFFFGLYELGVLLFVISLFVAYFIQIKRK